MKQKRRKRQKAAYIEYDYEAAYVHQIECLDEYFVEQMLKNQKVKSVYCTKEIKAGEQLEVEIYPEFTKKQASQIPDEARKKKQRQAQRNLNEKNSRKQCERVINENFTDEDIWATFTYTDDQMPASMEVAQQNMQRYIKKLNYHRKKAGLKNARYVYVTECSKNGRWHHHIVLDGEMDMDTVEKLWTHGERNEVRRLDKDENGLSGMANYITKQPSGKGQKRWTPSKNLRKPKEKKNHYKFKQKEVQEMTKNHAAIQPLFEKWYSEGGYIFRDAEVRYNDFNGRFYIYARLHKPKEKGARRRDGTDGVRKRGAAPPERARSKAQTQTKSGIQEQKPAGSSRGASDCSD